MGALIGLLFGIGALTVWLALASEVQTGQGSASLSPSSSAARSWIAPVACAGGAAVLSLVLTGLPFVALLAAVVGAQVPRAVSRQRAKRQRAQRAHAWPEVIDSLVSAVRAGMSLPEAVAAVGERGPAILRSDFAEFARDYRASGQFHLAITQLRQRLGDPVADRVFEAVLVAREVGGTDLGQMLRTVADFVRQDLRLRDEAAARRSWTVNGARLAIAAPWIVLVMLSTQPEVVAVYRTSAGVIVLAISAGVCAVAYWLMARLGELPEASRLGAAR